MADWQQYLNAVTKAAENVGADLQGATGIGSDAVTDKARTLVRNYSDYLNGMNNDRKNALSFEGWVKKRGGTDVDPNAAQKAKEYLENQDVISDTWKDVTNQGKMLFQGGKEAATSFFGGLGDHIPGILAGIGIPLIMSFMGGGGFSLMNLLLGAVAALGVDAMTSDKSYVSQIIEMFTGDKDKDSNAKENEQTRQKDLRIKAGVDAAPAIEPYQKPMPLGAVLLQSRGVALNLDANNPLSLNHNDPVWPDGANRAMDVVLNKESTLAVRVYGNIDDKGVFQSVGQRGIFPGDRSTPSPITQLNVSIPTRVDEASGQTFAVMDADTSAKLRIQSALATSKTPEKLANAQAEADFISGRFNVTSVQQAKGSKDVTITVASQSNPGIARTFGGTMDETGTLYINKIMQQNPDGTSTPQPLLLKNVLTLNNVGTGAVPASMDSPLKPAQPVTLDPNKVTSDKLAPLVKKFGPEVNDKDITPEIAAPSGLPTITKLDVGGKKARPAAAAVAP